MKKGPFKLKPKNKFDFGNKGKFNFNKTNDYSKKKKDYTKLSHDYPGTPGYEPPVQPKRGF